MTLEEQVKEIIAGQALMDPEELEADQNLEDLGLDSLGFVEIVYEIEEAFDIQIPFNPNDPEEVDFEFTTVQAVIDGLKDLMSSKA